MNSDILSNVAVVAVAAVAALSSIFIPSSFQEYRDITTFVSHDFYDERSFSSEEIREVVVYDAVSSKLPWLKSFYENAGTANSAKQILPLISGIKGLFFEKEYSLVDDILFEMEINKLSHTAMVAFISAVYPARHKLSSWALSVDKVKLALLHDDLDPNDILQGLI